MNCVICYRSYHLNSYVESLIPSVAVFGGGVLRRKLCLDEVMLGGLPLSHWCPCKGMKRAEMSLSHVMIQWGRPVYKLGSRPSTELSHPDPLISDFLLDPGILLQRPSQLRHAPKIGFQIYASWFLIWVEIWDIKWKRFHILM